MTKASNTAPDLAERAGYLIELAARAPSVHNTQPWRFAVTGQAIELYADTSRQLMEDPAGREMIISCGAALFGLRLAIRSLGCQPEVDLFPDPSHRHLLARVRAGRPEPMMSDERAMLQAMPRRHTHRGAFEPGPLPGGLLAWLQDDATAEGATLAAIGGGPAYQQLTAILAAWTRRRDLYPAHSFPAATGGVVGRLPQRDFDLGRGWGFPPPGGPPASVAAIMVTPGEDEQSWLCAGQALQRILLRAASQWVFARLQTQPLQSASVRAQIRSSLRATGSPQMLLELGVARITHPTARRAVGDLTVDG